MVGFYLLENDTSHENYARITFTTRLNVGFGNIYQTYIQVSDGKVVHVNL